MPRPEKNIAFANCLLVTERTRRTPTEALLIRLVTIVYGIGSMFIAFDVERKKRERGSRPPLGANRKLLKRQVQILAR